MRTPMIPITMFPVRDGLLTYEGTSWMYLFGTPKDMPANIDNYPQSYFSEVTVTENMTITLSYGFTTMVYQYT